MMDTRTGEYAFLDTAALKAFVSEPDPPPQKVLVWGTEDDVEAMSQRIRLGDREIANRKARRKAQKDARRRNRG